MYVNSLQHFQIAKIVKAINKTNFQNNNNQPLAPQQYTS
jgi:hypothetical protein